MRIDRNKLKIPLTKLNSKTKELIAKIKQTDDSLLLNELQKIKSWEYEKTELNFWVDVLDKFDHILEHACSKPKGSTWLMHCDLPENEKEKELVVHILIFTTNLIEHTFSRNAYNSINHLIALLKSSDLTLVIAVLNLLYVFSKRSNYITKLPHGRKIALLKPVLYLAESWGGKANGYALSKCCLDLPVTEFPPTATSLHFEFYPEIKKGSSTLIGPEDQNGPSNLSAPKSIDGHLSDKVASSPRPNLATKEPSSLVTIHVDHVDKLIGKQPLPSHVMHDLFKRFEIPEDKKIQLFSQVRLAYYFSNYEKRMLCIFARLRAISILLYSKSFRDKMDTYVYPGLIDELIELLQLKDPKLLEIQTAAIRTLTSLVHSNSSNSNLTNSVVDLTELSSYGGMLPTLVRSCIEELVLAKQTYPGTGSEMIGPGGQPDSTDLTSYGIALFSLMYHLANVHEGSEAILSGGLLKDFLRVISESRDSAVQIIFETRAVRIVDMVSSVDMQTFFSENGPQILVKRLQREIDICIHEQPYILPHECPVRNDDEMGMTNNQAGPSAPHHGDSLGPDAASIMDYEDGGTSPRSSYHGHDTLNNSTSSQAPNPKSMALDPSARAVHPCVIARALAPISGIKCYQPRAALLKSILNLLKNIVSEPAHINQYGRHMMNITFIGYLKHIISNVDYYGHSLFLLALDLVSNYIFSEPSELSSIQRSGMTTLMLKALLEKEVPPTREIMTSLPTIFTSLCLNHQGMQDFVACKPFDRLFGILISPKYLPALKAGKRHSTFKSEPAQDFGAMIDELLRHQPSLKQDAMGAICNVISELISMGERYPIDGYVDDPTTNAAPTALTTTLTVTSNTPASSTSNGGPPYIASDQNGSSGTGVSFTNPPTSQSMGSGASSYQNQSISVEDFNSNRRMQTIADERYHNNGSHSDGPQPLHGQQPRPIPNPNTLALFNGGLSLSSSSSSSSDEDEDASYVTPTLRGMVPVARDRSSGSSANTPQSPITPSDAISESSTLARGQSDTVSDNNSPTTLESVKNPSVTHFLEYMYNVLKFLEAIIGNGFSNDHCQAFVNQGGNDRLLKLPSLPILPLNFIHTNAFKALVSVYKWIVTYSHYPTLINLCLKTIMARMESLDLAAPVPQPRSDGVPKVERGLIHHKITYRKLCYISHITTLIALIRSMNKITKLEVKRFIVQYWTSSLGKMILSKLNHLSVCLLYESQKQQAIPRGDSQAVGTSDTTMDQGLPDSIKNPLRLTPEATVLMSLCVSLNDSIISLFSSLMEVCGSAAFNTTGSAGGILRSNRAAMLNRNALYNQTDGPLSTGTTTSSATNSASGSNTNSALSSIIDAAAGAISLNFKTVLTMYQNGTIDTKARCVPYFLQFLRQMCRTLLNDKKSPNLLALRKFVSSETFAYFFLALKFMINGGDKPWASSQGTRIKTEDKTGPNKSYDIYEEVFLDFWVFITNPDIIFDAPSSGGSSSSNPNPLLGPLFGTAEQQKQQLEAIHYARYIYGYSLKLLNDLLGLTGAASAPTFPFFNKSSPLFTEAHAHPEKLISGAMDPNEKRSALPIPATATKNEESASPLLLYEPFVIETLASVLINVIEGQAVIESRLSSAAAASAKAIDQQKTTRTPVPVSSEQIAATLATTTPPQPSIPPSGVAARPTDGGPLVSTSTPSTPVPTTDGFAVPTAAVAEPGAGRPDEFAAALSEPALISSLVDMGFPRSRVLEAVDHSSTLEQATEYLLSMAAADEDDDDEDDVGDLSGVDLLARAYDEPAGRGLEAVNMADSVVPDYHGTTGTSTMVVEEARMMRDIFQSLEQTHEALHRASEMASAFQQAYLASSAPTPTTSPPTPGTTTTPAIGPASDNGLRQIPALLASPTFPTTSSPGFSNSFDYLNPLEAATLANFGPAGQTSQPGPSQSNRASLDRIEAILQLQLQSDRNNATVDSTVNSTVTSAVTLPPWGPDLTDGGEVDQSGEEGAKALAQLEKELFPGTITPAGPPHPLGTSSASTDEEAYTNILKRLLNSFLPQFLSFLEMAPGSIPLLANLFSSLSKYNGPEWLKVSLETMLSLMEDSMKNFKENGKEDLKINRRLKTSTLFQLCAFVFEEFGDSNLALFDTSRLCVVLTAFLKSRLLSPSPTTTTTITTPYPTRSNQVVVSGCSPEWLLPCLLLLDESAKMAGRVGWVLFLDSFRPPVKRSWKWHDNYTGKWGPYSAAVNETVDRSFSDNRSSARFATGPRRYRVDFWPMTQTNEETKNRRPVMLELNFGQQPAAATASQKVASSSRDPKIVSGPVNKDEPSTSALREIVDSDDKVSNEVSDSAQPQKMEIDTDNIRPPPSSQPNSNEQLLNSTESGLPLFPPQCAGLPRPVVYDILNIVASLLSQDAPLSPEVLEAILLLCVRFTRERYACTHFLDINGPILALQCATTACAQPTKGNNMSKESQGKKKFPESVSILSKEIRMLITMVFRHLFEDESTLRLAIERVIQGSYSHLAIPRQLETNHQQICPMSPREFHSLIRVLGPALWRDSGLFYQIATENFVLTPSPAAQAKNEYPELTVNSAHLVKFVPKFFSKCSTASSHSSKDEKKRATSILYYLLHKIKVNYQFNQYRLSGGTSTEEATGNVSDDAQSVTANDKCAYYKSQSNMIMLLAELCYSYPHVASYLIEYVYEQSPLQMIKAFPHNWKDPLIGVTFLSFVMRQMIRYDYYYTNLKYGMGSGLASDGAIDIVAKSHKLYLSLRALLTAVVVCGAESRNLRDTLVGEIQNALGPSTHSHFSNLFNDVSPLPGNDLIGARITRDLVSVLVDASVLLSRYRSSSSVTATKLSEDIENDLYGTRNAGGTQHQLYLQQLALMMQLGAGVGNRPAPKTTVGEKEVVGGRECYEMPAQYALPKAGHKQGLLRELARIPRRLRMDDSNFVSTVTSILQTMESLVRLLNSVPSTVPVVAMLPDTHTTLGKLSSRMGTGHHHTGHVAHSSTFRTEASTAITSADNAGVAQVLASATSYPISNNQRSENQDMDTNLPSLSPVMSVTIGGMAAPEYSTIDPQQNPVVVIGEPPDTTTGSSLNTRDLIDTLNQSLNTSGGFNDYVDSMMSDRPIVDASVTEIARDAPARRRNAAGRTGRRSGRRRERARERHHAEATAYTDDDDMVLHDIVIVQQQQQQQDQDHRGIPTDADDSALEDEIRRRVDAADLFLRDEDDDIVEPIDDEEVDLVDDYDEVDDDDDDDDDEDDDEDDEDDDVDAGEGEDGEDNVTLYGIEDDDNDAVDLIGTSHHQDTSNRDRDQDDDLGEDFVEEDDDDEDDDDEEGGSGGGGSNARRNGTLTATTTAPPSAFRTHRRMSAVGRLRRRAFYQNHRFSAASGASNRYPLFSGGESSSRSVGTGAADTAGAATIFHRQTPIIIRDTRTGPTSHRPLSDNWANVVDLNFLQSLLDTDFDLTVNSRGATSTAPTAGSGIFAPFGTDLFSIPTGRSAHNVPRLFLDHPTVTSARRFVPTYNSNRGGIGGSAAFPLVSLDEYLSGAVDDSEYEAAMPIFRSNHANNPDGPLNRISLIFNGSNGPSTSGNGLGLMNGDDGSSQLNRRRRLSTVNRPAGLRIMASGAGGGTSLATSPMIGNGSATSLMESCQRPYLLRRMFSLYRSSLLREERTNEGNPNGPSNGESTNVNSAPGMNTSQSSPEPPLLPDNATVLTPMSDVNRQGPQLPSTLKRWSEEAILLEGPFIQNQIAYYKHCIFEKLRANYDRERKVAEGVKKKQKEEEEQKEKVKANAPLSQQRTKTTATKRKPFKETSSSSSSSDSESATNQHTTPGDKSPVNIPVSSRDSPPISSSWAAPNAMDVVGSNGENLNIVRQPITTESDMGMLVPPPIASVESHPQPVSASPDATSTAATINASPTNIPRPGNDIPLPKSDTLAPLESMEVEGSSQTPIDKNEAASISNSIFPEEPSPYLIPEGQNPSTSQETSSAPENQYQIVLGEGLDPSFLTALPENLRQEVMSEQIRLQHIELNNRRNGSRPPTGGSASSLPPLTQPIKVEISPEFLAALPPNIQSEILVQQQTEQERQNSLATRNRERAAAAASSTTTSGTGSTTTNATITGSGDSFDPALFIHTLPFHLRQQVLSDMDDTMLAVLPPDLAEEARTLQRHIEVRHRRLQQSLFGAQWYRLTATSANGALGPQSTLTSGGVSSRRPPANQSNTGALRQLVSSGNLVASRGGKRLLDYESLGCLLILTLFKCEHPKMARKVGEILRELSRHPATFAWIFEGLLSFMEAPTFLRQGNDNEDSDHIALNCDPDGTLTAVMGNSMFSPSHICDNKDGTSPSSLSVGKEKGPQAYGQKSGKLLSPVRSSNIHATSCRWLTLTLKTGLGSATRVFKSYTVTVRRHYRDNNYKTANRLGQGIVSPRPRNDVVTYTMANTKKVSKKLPTNLPSGQGFGFEPGDHVYSTVIPVIYPHPRAIRMVTKTVLDILLSLCTDTLPLHLNAAKVQYNHYHHHQQQHKNAAGATKSDASCGTKDVVSDQNSLSHVHKAGPVGFGLNRRHTYYTTNGNGNLVALPPTVWDAVYKLDTGRNIDPVSLTTPAAYGSNCNDIATPTATLPGAFSTNYPYQNISAFLPYEETGVGGDEYVSPVAASVVPKPKYPFPRSLVPVSTASNASPPLPVNIDGSGGSSVNGPTGSTEDFCSASNGVTMSSGIMNVANPFSPHKSRGAKSGYNSHYHFKLVPEYLALNALYRLLKLGANQSAILTDKELADQLLHLMSYVSNSLVSYNDAIVIPWIENVEKATSALNRIHKSNASKDEDIYENNGEIDMDLLERSLRAFLDQVVDRFRPRGTPSSGVVSSAPPPATGMCSEKGLDHLNKTLIALSKLILSPKASSNEPPLRICFGPMVLRVLLAVVREAGIRLKTDVEAFTIKLESHLNRENLQGNVAVAADSTIAERPATLTPVATSPTDFAPLSTDDRNAPTSVFEGLNLTSRTPTSEVGGSLQFFNDKRAFPSQHLFLRLLKTLKQVYTYARMKKQQADAKQTSLPSALGTASVSLVNSSSSSLGSSLPNTGTDINPVNTDYGDRDPESDKLIDMSLAKLVGLEPLWDALSRCLLHLERVSLPTTAASGVVTNATLAATAPPPTLPPTQPQSQQQTLTLILQPTVEAFFLIHAHTPQAGAALAPAGPVFPSYASVVVGSIANTEGGGLVPDHSYPAPLLSTTGTETMTAPSTTPATTAESTAQRTTIQSTEQAGPSNTASHEPLSEETRRFLNFATSHRQVLNQILRQQQGPHSNLRYGPFSILASNYAHLLDFDIKRRYFREVLERLPASNSASASDNFGHHHRTGEDFPVHVRRNQVFEDSYRELHRQPSSVWKSRFYIIFEGEEGQDAGGLLREWYSIIAREIFNPNYALFRTSPGDRVTYTINPASHCNSNHLSYFKFVGRVIAKAIYDNKHLECYFTRSFYKHILGKNVKYSDMESEDYEFYQGLVYLLENNVESLGYDLSFSTQIQEFGVTETRDLKSNGQHVLVSEDNKQEYVALLCQMKMTGAIRQQLNSFLEGFYDVIPKNLISIFNEQELELFISGLPNFDIEDLRLNTEYHKYVPESLQIKWFWRALRSFDQATKAKFLQFVTGTSKVPLQGFSSLEGMNGTQKFQIYRDNRSTDRLPSAHTCFNQLDLPAYETYEKLHAMLLKAILECSEGFGLA